MTRPITIRKAIRDHAVAFDLDQPQVDRLITELEALAAWAKVALPKRVATAPDRPSDLLAAGKKFDQLAVHAEALARLLDEIGAAGRHVLAARYGDQQHEFEQRTAQWLRPLRALSRPKSLILAPRRALWRFEAARVVQVAAAIWHDTLGAPPEPFSACFTNTTSALLNAVRPGLGRRPRDTIAMARGLAISSPLSKGF